MQKNHNAVVLDTSAILAHFREEKGFEIIEPLLHSALVCAANITECYYMLCKFGIDARTTNTILNNTFRNVKDIDYKLSLIAGEIKVKTFHLGLSLGDAFCIATAIDAKLPVYTADKVWSELEQLFDIKINLIR